MLKAIVTIIAAILAILLIVAMIWGLIAPFSGFIVSKPIVR